MLLLLLLQPLTLLLLLLLLLQPLTLLLLLLLLLQQPLMLLLLLLLELLLQQLLQLQLRLRLLLLQLQAALGGRDVAGRSNRRRGSLQVFCPMRALLRRAWRCSMKRAVQRCELQ